MIDLQTAVCSILKNSQIDSADVSIIQNQNNFHLTVLPDGVRQPEYSRYLVNSIAKIFIASLVMQLSEKGLIGLDEPIIQWFPETRGLEGITIKMLLNHHAGLPDYGQTRAYLKAIVANPLKPWSFDEYVNNTLEKGLIAPPGEKFNYSNLGYAFLKQIIEKVTRVEFAQYLAETLLTPLNLKNTVMLNSSEDLVRITPAMSYSVIPSGQAVDIRYHYHPGWVAHGLMASTAGDISKFLDYLFGGQIVSPNSLKTMMQSTPVSFQAFNLNNPGYGLGLMTAETQHGWIYGHTGGGPGFLAVGYHLRSHIPVSIAILTNNEMAFSLEKAMIEIIGLTQN